MTQLRAAPWEALNLGKESQSGGGGEGCDREQPPSQPLSTRIHRDPLNIPKNFRGIREK